MKKTGFQTSFQTGSNWNRSTNPSWYSIFARLVHECSDFEFNRIQIVSYRTVLDRTLPFFTITYLYYRFWTVSLVRLQLDYGSRVRYGTDRLLISKVRFGFGHMLGEVPVYYSQKRCLQFVEKVCLTHRWFKLFFNN